jgi:hypothetical protein
VHATLYYNQKTLKRQDAEHVQQQRNRLKQMISAKIQSLFDGELGVLKEDQIILKERFISSQTSDLLAEQHSADVLSIDTTKLEKMMVEETVMNQHIPDENMANAAKYGV